MEKSLVFWSSMFWLLLECWISDPSSKVARVAEIIVGIFYVIGSSFVIALSEDPLMGLAAFWFTILGIYHVSGASSEPLSPYDYYG